MVRAGMYWGHLKKLQSQELVGWLEITLDLAAPLLALDILSGLSFHILTMGRACYSWAAEGCDLG